MVFTPGNVTIHLFDLSRLEHSSFHFQLSIGGPTEATSLDCDSIFLFNAGTVFGYTLEVIAYRRSDLVPVWSMLGTQDVSPEEGHTLTSKTRRNKGEEKHNCWVFASQGWSVKSEVIATRVL